MSNLDTIDHMIQRLGTDLKPVRRLRPPGVRALLWLAGVAALACVLGCFADLPAIAHRLMGAPDMWLAVLGSTLTAILGALAVFHLSVPGRSPWWALLPVPGLALWIGASGMGCLRSWLIPETHDASMGEVRICLVFIVAVSVPLSVVMVLMIRRACPLRPNLAALVGGTAIAAGAASLLNFFHPYDASATDLMVHLLAVAIVVVLNQLVARWALAHRRRPPAV